MFGENLKRARQKQGISQEELASRLHVVRQTVSKWERGLSVPDADLLVRLAEILDIPVSVLLGGMPEPDAPAPDTVAQQLAAINAQLAARSRFVRRVVRVVAGICIGIAALYAVLMVLGFGAFRQLGAQQDVQTVVPAQEIRLE